MVDSISYELMNEEPREVWLCTGACKRYRHRRSLKDLLPAICCGQPAQLIDRYSQPIPVVVEDVIESGEAHS